MLSMAAVVALLAFLVVRSRTNPLFLAGAATFFVLGRAVFIDVVPNQQLLSTPLTTGDMVFVILGLGLLYARRLRPAPRADVRARWVWLAAVLVIFIVLELALTLSNQAFHPTRVLPVRDWLFIPIGYVMMLDILRRFSAREVEEYLGGLCLVTTLLMVLYIASALNVPVYPYAKYFTTTYGGVTITRDFSTLPLWAGVAWAYYLSRPMKSWRVLAALGILAIGMILTYTRSVVLVEAGVAVLAALLHMAHRDLRSRSLAVAGPLLLLMVGVVLVTAAVLPAQYGYLQSRFQLIRIGGGTSVSDRNLGLRTMAFEAARRAGAEVDPVFGAGLFDSSPNGSGYVHDSADSDWIRIIFRAGWAGVAVFLAPLLIGLWWGVRQFLTEPADHVPRRVILLTGLLSLSGALGLQFTGLMYFMWPVLSLFALALVAYAASLPALSDSAASGSGEIGGES